jgi:Lon protease-like protein
MCVGAERIRVDRWLPDAPHPRAAVSPWHDEGSPVVAGSELAAAEERFAAVRELARRLAPELPGGPPVELSPDPTEAVWQMAIGAPLGPLDRQRLLECPALAPRVALLADVLADLELILRAQLAE